VTGVRLALSLGDPSGIGPEITGKAWRALRATGPAFVVVGDAETVTAALGSASDIRVVQTIGEGVSLFATALPVIDIPLPAPAKPGRPSPGSSALVIRWIEAAARLAISGEADALVTAPIAKAPLYAAGFAFPGHTEFLGELAPTPPGETARGPVMMLAAADLRISLVTIHEPLSRVPGLLTIQTIVNAGLVTTNALRRDFGIDRPRLAVAGLNPHAGEAGAIGDEEIAIIAPAVRELAALGVEVSGPHPSDTLFHPEARARYDAALCLYHDQALIPVKMLDFWGGVNVTLGLSIVRTSPDHGVGYDIAGQGVARPDSLIAALELAAAIAGRRAA
jgi:4-hydroxythreonine-4-phosphate dehydrogenase